MAQVYVKYNPYRLTTNIKVNGKEIREDSILYKLLRGKRLQEWVGEFPQKLVDEYNTVDFDVEFCGMDLDWDDFEDSMNTAKDNGVIDSLNLKFIQGKNDEDVTDKIIEIFSDLKDGPIDDFRDPKLLNAFDNIRNSIFPINVIATMSSGKSTLINALLRKRLMPYKNEACTATITEIFDTDQATYTAEVFNGEGEKIVEINDLTYEEMEKLNVSDDVSRIKVEGDIPFLDSKETSLCLVDTPGPNNSENQGHKNVTYSAINSDSNNLILYVLNGTQLGTNDDDNLLNYVAEQIRKGGKQARDRFLFVVNKMDAFNPEEENIEEAVERAKKYLARHGIDDPQIFPCSARTALNIDTYFLDKDIDNMTRAEERALPTAARETLPIIDKFNDYPAMHLEQYTTLSPSAQRELNYRLKKAADEGSSTEQALIHSGVPSIEAAITAYVKKYAKTKKVKDLVESFEEVLVSNQVLARAKTQVATDKQAAAECADRAKTIHDKIDNGEEAKEFRSKVQNLDPMPAIRSKTDELMDKAERKIVKIFDYYGEEITDRGEAKRLIKQFAAVGSDAIAELASEMESLINHEVVDTGEKILEGYQEKLNAIDTSSDDKKLDFKTADLVKGSLASMRDKAASWSSDQFAVDTVDDYGEVTHVTKKYYEKVGEKKEKVISGTHQEKIGTKKVKVGSHQKKVGTKKVKNWEREGWGFFAFWKPWKIDEDVYQEVDDYKDEDVYQTITDYKTVVRDVFAERTESIETFSVKVDTLQTGLLSSYRANLDEGVNSAMKFAEEQVADMKQQFSGIFDQLDDIIKKKYDELKVIGEDQQKKEEELKHNEAILAWIEENQREINNALNI